MTKPRVLLVDDEPMVLSGYRRQLRNDIDMTGAESGKLGLEAIANDEPFHVVVSDMRMPQMDGVEFLKKVKQVSPDSVRLMLTGNADLETAMKAVNEGNIFRFLTKPCQSETLLAAITDAHKQHQLIVAERELLEQTLKGSVKVLTQIIATTDPDAFHQAESLQKYVKKIAPQLGLDNTWELEVAAMLHPIGLLTMPSELRAKLAAGAKLQTSEAEILAEIPRISHRLISNIPRLEETANVVKHFGGRYRDDLKEVTSQTIPKGAKILRILHELTVLEDRGMTTTEALAYLVKHPEGLDEKLLERISALVNDFGGGNSQVLDVSVEEILPGDIVKSDVTTKDERLLLKKGTQITDVFLERLKNYNKLVGVLEPIRVDRRLQHS